MKKKLIGLFLICSILVNGIGFQSSAVEVTKTSGSYTGVVSLTRYTSNGVAKVKNGKAISCKIRKLYALVQTYTATSKSVALMNGGKSYTLNSSGLLTDIEDPKPTHVSVSIAGFK